MKNTILLTCVLFVFFKNGQSQIAAPNDSLVIYLQMAETAMQGDDWVLSNAHYIAAERLAAAQNNEKALCQIESGLAKIASQANRPEDLAKAVSKAERFCRVCGDSIMLARVFLQTGVLKYMQGQLDSSALFFERSSALYAILGQTLRAANSLVKVGNVREEQKKYLEANAYYMSFYETALQQPDKTYHLTANIYLCSNNLYLNRPKEALRHIFEARHLAEQLGAKYEYCKTLQYEAFAYEKMGQFEKAYESTQRYAAYYQDSLLNAEKVAQIENLRAQYETEKKESQIALQSAQLVAQRRTLWSIGGFLALALGTGFWLFRLAQKLRKSNAEKAFLIKEIHHRVKNNLQVLSSLLHLQSRSIQDESALGAVREGQNRVDAMGLIHQKLYMGDNLATVEMRDYVQNLGDTLLDSFGMEERVSLQYQLDPLHLDVDTAIPLGLIINELLTNSLKYAFPGDGKGELTLALWKTNNRKLCLQVADNGVGKNAPPNAPNSTGFGTKLVQLLSQKLKGTVVVTADERGYATRIEFEGRGV